MIPHVVDTAAGPVEVAETGAGPAVLVVHGTPGDWRQARALADDLAPSYRVLLPSRPGYGRTPLDTGRSPREQAAAHAALLDALGVPAAAVIGISGGGPSARALAAHFRNRCSALVLCCAVAEHLVTVPVATRLLGSVPGVWEAGARLARRRAARRLQDRQTALADVVAGLGPSERASVAGDMDAEESMVAFAHSRHHAMASVAGLRNDFRWFRAATLPEPWPAGRELPVLVLHGDADDVVPLAHGEHHRDAIPGAVLEVVPGAGHLFVLSMRRQVSGRIAQLLEGA